MNDDDPAVREPDAAEARENDLHAVRRRNSALRRRIDDLDRERARLVDSLADSASALRDMVALSRCSL